MYACNPWSNGTNSSMPTGASSITWSSTQTPPAPSRESSTQGQDQAKLKRYESTRSSAPSPHTTGTGWGTRRQQKYSGSRATRASPETKRPTNSRVPRRKGPDGPRPPHSPPVIRKIPRSEGGLASGPQAPQSGRDPTTAAEEIMHGQGQELHCKNGGPDQDRPLALRGIPEESPQTHRQQLLVLQGTQDDPVARASPLHEHQTACRARRGVGRQEPGRHPSPPLQSQMKATPVKIPRTVRSGKGGGRRDGRESGAGGEDGPVDRMGSGREGGGTRRLRPNLTSFPLCYWRSCTAGLHIPWG